MTASPPIPTTMQAIVHRRYGGPDVLRLEDVEVPAVDDDTILVRVRAASINAYDWHLMRGDPYLVRTEEGVLKPKRAIAGVDMAGQVEAVGKNVTEFRPGDAVFGERDGAFAEYVAAKATSLALKPGNLTFEKAAAVPMAGFTALQALRDKGRVQPGQRVLVTGAAGGVGSFAIQLAKAFGATVTGVCHTENVEMVRSMGADDVIDYTAEDFTRRRETFDLILDIAASPSLIACRRVLSPGGTLVVVGAPMGRWFAPLRRPIMAVVLSQLGSKRLLPFLARRSKDDLVVLASLIEAGTISPVVDSAFPMKHAADAMRHMENDHIGGKVVITV